MCQFFFFLFLVRADVVILYLLAIMVAITANIGWYEWVSCIEVDKFHLLLVNIKAPSALVFSAVEKHKLCLSRDLAMESTLKYKTRALGPLGVISTQFVIDQFTAENTKGYSLEVFNLHIFIPTNKWDRLITVCF